MKKIIITLEIENAEVVEEYWGVEDELIFDDIRFGQLTDFCKIGSVKMINDSSPGYARHTQML